MTTVIERTSDMDPQSYLRVLIQEDGDVLVQVRQAKQQFVQSESCVEFCTRLGGGASPRTLAALKALAVAMAEDSLDINCRAGNGNCLAATPPQLLVDRFSSRTISEA